MCAHQVFEEWLKENDKILRFRFFFKFLLAFIFICLFLFGFINCWYQVFVSEICGTASERWGELQGIRGYG